MKKMFMMILLSIVDRSRNSSRGNSSSEIEWPCGTTRSGRSSRYT